MNVDTAGALMTVERTLLVQLNPELTDSAVRQLRDAVGRTLEAQALRGLVLDLASVEVMDSYITRCIRDLALCARLMGVPTIVCGVQPAVADTLVEMGLELGEVQTVLNVDVALRTLRTLRTGRRARA
ncbi:MAG: STAS domain-containing protein [Byssovorax sp.]|jgi:rsbT antagonist protein RsbS